jgi:ceramide glucosyltransferase
MRTTLISLFVVMTGTGGEIALTHAMKRLGEVRQFSPASILRFVARALLQGWMWVGVGLLALSFCGFLTMLSWYPVSFVMPVTSLGYIAGPLGAKFLLRERLSVTRWAGIVLIFVGVALAWADQASRILSAAALREAGRDAVFLLAVVPLAFYVFGAWAAVRFFGRPKRTAPPAADFAPPVSILKPVRGLDRGAYENFASFCQQDYPEYEILFAATDESDPAVPVIRQLMRDFPQRPIRLLLGVERKGANDKVAKLCRLVREARHSLLVITDSDVRVAPDYLRDVAALFADPRVGAVTALYRALEAPSFGAALDAVGASASFASSALVARALEGLKFAMGSTLATTRERLAEIGGFEALLDLHSDDYEFGRRIADGGYRVELAPKPVDMEFPSETLGDYLRHELRWVVGIRHIRPGGHFGMIMTHGLFWAALAAAVAPTGTLAAAWLCAYFAVRLVTGWVVGVWGLGDPVLRRKLWLLPLHDFFAFLTWLASFVVNRIEWRGLIFTLEKGRMTPVASPPDRG